MKTNLLVLSFFLLISLTSFSQTFYIEKTEGGFELPIMDKLLELDKKITAKQEVSDYTIKCMIEKTGMGRATGSVMIFDSKTGELVEKTKKVKGQTSILVVTQIRK